MQYDEFADKMMDFFDAVVDQGNDEELFASGYLSGHFSLAIASVDLQTNKTVTALLQKMQIQLEEAFNLNELEEQDQTFVEQCWENWQVKVLTDS